MRVVKGTPSVRSSWIIIISIRSVVVEAKTSVYYRISDEAPASSRNAERKRLLRMRNSGHAPIRRPIRGLGSSTEIHHPDFFPASESRKLNININPATSINPFPLLLSSPPTQTQTRYLSITVYHNGFHRSRQRCWSHQ